MKIDVTIQMSAEIEITDITSATVIQNLAQPDKPKRVIMADVMDDRHFEIAARNQRLLEQLKADESLLLRYVKLVALFEVLSKLAEGDDMHAVGDELEEIKKSVAGRLPSGDSEWFRGAMKAEAFSESTEYFDNAFRVTLSKSAMSASCVSGQ